MTAANSFSQWVEMRQQILKRTKKRDRRTDDQIREHYEIEKKLANRLLNSSKDERKILYSSVYDDLFRLVPHHTMLTRKNSPQEQKKAVTNQMKILSNLLDKHKTFLEIGPGDCTLSFRVSDCVRQVFAVDISTTITDSRKTPSNCKLFISDGSTIPVPRNSIDVAYSHQLMEHLHPDDAIQQLRNIYQALSKGGVYLCITPNKLNGPHDISRYFDSVATGLHLKEYTVGELNALFQEVGFSKVKIILVAKGFFLSLPATLIILIEKLLCLLPRGLRYKLANTKLISALISIRILGMKR